MKIYKRKTALISGDLVLRDDQAEYSALLDAAKERRAGGARLKLIDAGRLSVFELEWLGLAGSELFTSDAVHRDLSDFILMIAATKKGGGAVAYFHQGPLAEIPSAATLQREAVRELARSGAFIYLSNKSAVRDADTLAVLADDARNGGSRLVYYHHGALSDDLEEAARRGAWKSGRGCRRRGRGACRASGAPRSGGDPVRSLRCRRLSSLPNSAERLPVALPSAGEESLPADARSPSLLSLP
jgi:hypothetical protein